MSPQLKKEFHPLWWPLALAVLAMIGYACVAAPALLIPAASDSRSGAAIWIVGVILIAAGAFSAEYAGNAMQLTMSQPVPRYRLWGTKLLAVIMAAGVLGLVFGAIFYGWRSHSLPSLPELNVVGGGIVYATVAIAAAAFWARIARSSVGTVAFVVATIWVVMLGNGILRGLGFHPGPGVFLGTALVLGFLGWLLFATLQLRGQSIRSITEVSRESALGERLTALKVAPGRPVRNFILKELHLQRPTFLMLVVLTALVLLGDATVAWGLIRPSDAFTFFAAANFIFTLLVAVLSASAPICEETGLGTAVLNWTLPWARQALFAGKLLVAIAVFIALQLLSVLLYLHATVLAELPVSLFPGLQLVLDLFLRGRPPHSAWDVLGNPLIILTAVFAVSTWVASVSKDGTRTALAAVPASFALIGTFLFFYSSHPSSTPLDAWLYTHLTKPAPPAPLVTGESVRTMWAGTIPLLTGLVVFSTLAGVVVLGASNFDHRPVSLSRFFRQAAMALGLAFLAGMATGMVDGAEIRLRRAEFSRASHLQRQLTASLNAVVLEERSPTEGTFRDFSWDELAATGLLGDDVLNRYRSETHRIRGLYLRQGVSGGYVVRIEPGLTIDGNEFFVPRIETFPLTYRRTWLVE